MPPRVLTEDDWRRGVAFGYVIVRRAVPPDNVERLVDLLWCFDERDPQDRSTWGALQRRGHRMKELDSMGMLEIYNHKYLWDNRMTPRIYDAFVDIWDRESQSAGQGRLVKADQKARGRYLGGSASPGCVGRRSTVPDARRAICMSGAIAGAPFRRRQSSVNRVRSRRPISRSALVSAFCRG